MRTVFQSDFKNPGAMASWTKEQHTPPGFLDFRLQNGNVELLDPGNRLLPNVPTLKEFQAEVIFTLQFAASQGRFSFSLHFDYDCQTRKGREVEIASEDGKTLQVFLNRKKQRISNGEKIMQDIAKKQRIRLQLERNKSLNIAVNGISCFQKSIPDGSGVMAVERGHFPGTLFLSSFKVASPLPKPQKILSVKLPFSPINGMPNPIDCEAIFFKNGDGIMVKTRLSGGVITRPDIPWFPYHGVYSEFLTAPYMRLQYPSGEEIPLLMSDKRLVLSKRTGGFYYMKGVGFERPEWPMCRTFYFKAFNPKDILLVLGYKHYMEPVVGKAFMGGPSEMVYDIASRKTLYAGAALTPNRIQVELHSLPNKKLLSKIPKNHPRQDRIEHFLQLNHFFNEGDECTFHFEIDADMSLLREELSMEYILADAFLTPIGKWKKVSQFSVKTLTPKIHHFVSGGFSCGKLPGGVYHILFRCRQGARLIIEENRAFEVMTEKLSGPQASKLPILYSTPNEVAGVDSNEFDPFLGQVSDVCHYVDTAAGVMPHIAEEQQVAPLYKLFHRKWFPWFTPRTTENQNFKNFPSIKSCDYIAMSTEWQKKCLVRICGRAFYTGPQLQQLAKYGKKINFHSEELEKCAKNNQIPPLEIFQELVNEHFCEWMDYFNDAFRRDLEEMMSQLRKVNAHAGLVNYGPLAIYPAAYKTAHSCQYVFSYLTRPDGKKSVYQDKNCFFNFGDYPYCCRHNILRGPFMTADILLEYPDVRICPEVYTPNNSGPNPDAAVARAWPSLGMCWGGPAESFPINTTLKRVLEYSYGAIRHDGKAFGYWTERGFHSRCWERQRYQAFLKLLGFIRNHEPQKPAGRVCGFLCSETCIRAHRYFYDEYGDRDVYTPYGDLFNTAEETPAFAYEMSRFAGMNAGCVVNEKSLEGISAKEIDVLVLPPLSGASKKTLANIRRLHREGVALFGFEDVGGLEDLFGVRKAKKRQVHCIAGTEKLPLELQTMTEYTEHRGAVGEYEADGASILLKGEVPVLFTFQTAYGKTALFNIPPTVVRREDQVPRVAMGRDSISPLINGATQYVLQMLSNNDVSTTDGKLIAFQDQKGDPFIVVEEDAHPEPPTPIAPVVTIQNPGLIPHKFHCPDGCSVIEHTSKILKLRIHLKEDEYTIIPLT